MAYRFNDRKQMKLLPPSIDDCVRKEDSVREYDAFVDILDCSKFGIEVNPHKIRCPSMIPELCSYF